MKNKKLSDYEKLFLEKIEDKTIKELLHDHRSSKHAKQYHADSIVLELKDLFNDLEREFFKFALKEKGFLDIPILAAVRAHYYDCDYDNDDYSLLIEKTFTAYYKSIDLINGNCSISFKLFPKPDAILTCGYNTIGEFINR